MPICGLIDKKSRFDELLKSNQIDNELIVFIEDTQEIWTQGKYYGVSKLAENRISSLETIINEIHPADYIKDSHVAITQQDYDTRLAAGTIDKDVFYYIIEE